MSPASDDNGRPGAAQDRPGVLANLPRTRPQRSSPRRAAARQASAESAAANGDARVAVAAAASAAATKPPAKRKAAAKRAPAKRASATARPSAVKPRVRRASAKAGAVAADPAPIQGFECDGDRASGPVQPTGGSEFAASAAEILGELTKAGFATGERLLKDVLARLPLS